LSGFVVLLAGNSSPYEDGTADRRTVEAIELRRNTGRAGVQLDALDVAGQHLVDIEVHRRNSVHKILRRTVAAWISREAQCRAPVVQRHDSDAGDHAHVVAQLLRAAALDIGTGDEITHAGLST